MLSNKERTVFDHCKNYIELLDTNTQVLIANHLVNFAWDNRRKFLNEKAKQRYQIKKQQELEAKPQKQMMVKLALKPGDIIKITGTRDSGMREVASFSGTKVVCYQLIGTLSNTFSVWQWSSPATLDNYQRNGVKTKNDLSKVTHIAKDGKWCDFKKEWV